VCVLEDERSRERFQTALPPSLMVPVDDNTVLIYGNLFRVGQEMAVHYVLLLSLTKLGNRV